MAGGGRGGTCCCCRGNGMWGRRGMLWLSWEWNGGICFPGQGQGPAAAQPTMELLIPFHFSTIIYLSSLVSFLCGWLALHIALLFLSSTSILFLLALVTLVLLSIAGLGLLQIAVARQDKVKKVLISTARQRCRCGCHHQSQSQVLCCPHCKRSMEFHQYCLRPKKHTSSNNMCCVCLFVMVTTGYVMAVLLSCFIYLVPIPLWSINTATICTIMMILLATVCLNLIKPWVPCIFQAQHTLRCQPLSRLGTGDPGATRVCAHPSPPVTLLHTGCYHGQNLAGRAGANSSCRG
ncbi:uncharacterized protein LOC110355242 isoform X3 [Columba livia]|uniref:uncharacterized protein LOC110355242 isoform X3 n=1 Tax=Columba livia TaxID=8932 RepID=UPI0031BB4F77